MTLLLVALAGLIGGVVAGIVVTLRSFAAPRRRPLRPPEEYEPGGAALSLREASTWETDDEDYDPVDDPRTWTRIEQQAKHADRLRAVSGVIQRRSLKPCGYCGTIGHTKPDCPVRERL